MEYKALKAGWWYGKNSGKYNDKLLPTTNMYEPYITSAIFLNDGISEWDMLEVFLIAATGGASSVGKKITVKVASQALFGAYLNWQIQILLFMLDDQTFEQAVANVNYSDVAWAGMTSIINNYKISGALNCVRSSVNTIQTTQEINISSIGFTCILEIVKSGVFHALVSANNSP